MNLSLAPDIRRFINDQVRAGRFATPEAVVEAAIVNMRDTNDAELDDQTIAAINEGEEQGDRGEGIELAAFREQWKKKLNAGK
jgi:Arc/MetJ-type ribon-helix-helix transcriptional regulator